MAKRLIAARSIQYRGRTYESGDPIPAHDPKMTEAWLKHGSAKWEDINTQPATKGVDSQMGLVAVHLDAATLSKLKTEDLEKLAADLGVDISGAKTNTERAELIAAMEVLIPKIEAAQ